MIKTILKIVAVIITINSLFLPGDFSTESTTEILVEQSKTTSKKTCKPSEI